MSAPAGPLILVVDDDPSIADMLALALEDRGYAVCCSAGADAARVARERCPAVILVDLLMPDVDGVEVCLQLSTHPATTAIPVVLMSAGRYLEEAARRLRIAAVLPKPFDLDQLYAVLEQVQQLPPARRPRAVRFGC